jgi:RNA-directed DNA polymerase
MADEANTACSKRTEDWNTFPWKDIQKSVFRLQRRIYQAVYCSTLQCCTPERGQARSRPTTVVVTLLVGTLSSGTPSDAGQCVCFASVGKRTPGIDGVASLTPRQRMQLKPKYALDADITKCFDLTC